jgi:dienelactone hydrolase
MVVKNLGLVLGLMGIVWAGCGGDETNLPTTVTSGTGASGSTSGAGGGTGGTTTGGGGMSTSGSGSGSGTGSGTSSGNPMDTIDPNGNGPFAIVELVDAQFTNAATGNKVPMDAYYPVGGPAPGPYPVVIVAHGFQLPAKQYTNYIKRLATFGYVAITADFPASFFGQDNTKNAKDLISAIDWAAGKPELKADTTKVGMTGHSLGGKLALLASTMDPRVKASIVLDPVDGGGGPGGGCNPPQCVDVSALMPQLKIPTGFLGETTDSAGGIQPCAPAAENFLTFYMGTNAPSLAVTVKGANHMSFLDDVSSCGATCSFCNMATVDNATVNSLSLAYVTAFYERYIRSNTGYDTYLTGAEATTRYVDTNLANIQSK